MFEAYSIGVTLKVHNLISPQLAILSAEMKEVERLSTLLHASMKKLGAVGMGALNMSLGATNRAFERASVSAGALQARIVSMHSAASLPLPAMLASLRPAYAPSGGRHEPGGGGGRGTGGFHGGNLHANSGGLGVSGVGIGLGGAGMVAAGGVMGLMALNGPVNKALEYERYTASLRQQGLGDGQIKDAQKFVSATNIINTSMLDRMRIFTETQGAFRESGKSGLDALTAAKEMLPILATYEVATATLSGPKHEKAEGAMKSLYKMIEMMGGIGNHDRAVAIADGAFKAVRGSGGMIDERQLKQFFAYGASATNQQSLRTVFGGLEPIIGELGGSTVATGMRTAYSRMNGMMSLPPKLMLHEMGRLHMLDSTGKKQTNTLADLQATNIIDYVAEMMKRYAAAGISTQTGRERENAILFGPNASRGYNKMMSQMPVLLASMAQFDGAKGADATANDPANKSLMARTKFHKKWEDLQLTMGMDGGLLDLATRGLTAFSAALGAISEFTKSNPGVTKFVAYSLAAVSVMAILGGSIFVLKTAFSGLALVTGPLLRGGLLALRAAFSGLSLIAVPLIAAIGGGAGLIALLGKAGLAGAAVFSIVEVGRLALALKELFNIKTRDGVTLNADATNRLSDPATKAKLDAMNTDFRGANQLPPGGMTATGKPTYGANYMSQPHSIQPTQHTSVVMLDKKVLGTALTEFQAKELRRPTFNDRYFDGIMSLQGNY